MTLRAQALAAIVTVVVVNDVRSAPPENGRLHGYVGGPYKVLIAEATGDASPDILLGYRGVGTVAVHKGDGTGAFRHLALTRFGDGDRRVETDDKKWSVPHVHNMDATDLDGDGRVDLLLAIGGTGQHQHGRIVLARNTGSGQFERRVEFRVPSEAKGVRLADLDRDGTSDLLYTARGSGYENDLKRGRLYIHRGLGNWNFGPPRATDAGRSAYYVETSDLNRDGFDDVIIPNEHDTCIIVYLNPGRKIFDKSSEFEGRRIDMTRIEGRRSHAVNDVRSAELNGDGIPDLLTANLGTSTVSVLIGRGDGTFEPDQLLEAGKNGAFLATADFNEDGHTDFAIAHWTERFTSVFLNVGDGTFAERVDYQAGLGNYGVAAGDLNGDGHADLVTANYREYSYSVLLGIGDGTFRAAKTVNAAWRGHGTKLLPYTP